MYAYFGGAGIFSDIITWTGCLQLAVGILVEVFVVVGQVGGKGGCGEGNEVWANVVGLVLLLSYAVLFSGDLRERGKKVEQKEEKKEQ